MVIDLAETDVENQESVFHKKLKVKLKEKGKKGRIEFLKDYMDFILTKDRPMPPDFPTFTREIMGKDDRGGFIHITIWHSKSELVEFAQDRGYEHRVDIYD